jgi:hypothetical protein
VVLPLVCADLIDGCSCSVQAQNINMNIVWTAVSLVLTRCFAVYTQAQTQRTMLQQQMTSSLYDKMQDSQEGVISVITEVGVPACPCCVCVVPVLCAILLRTFLFACAPLARPYAVSCCCMCSAYCICSGETRANEREAHSLSCCRPSCSSCTCCLLLFPLLFSLQELSDQQLKQMLLAYMVLIMKGRAMKKDDLDTACEVCVCEQLLIAVCSSARQQAGVLTGLQRSAAQYSTQAARFPCSSAQQPTNVAAGCHSSPTRVCVTDIQLACCFGSNLGSNPVSDRTS